MYYDISDLGRMYQLVSRIQDGLGELKTLLETHIYNQGLAAVEKCGDAALNVSYLPLFKVSYIVKLSFWTDRPEQVL